MKKSCVTLINKQFSSRQNLFLKDPRSDLFVIVNEKIYPLHKSFLNEVGYFSNEEFKNEKVHMIDSNIDQKYFQMIIGYFYGKQLQFSRNWDIEKLLQTIRYFNIPEIQKKILNDIKNNFDDYGFFLLLSIAHKFKVKWLKEKCEQQLILMGFQQLNYNRYDLFQVDKQTLQQIIKLHEILKINQNILGLRNTDLKRIINEYCKANNVEIQVDEMLTSCQSSTKFSKIQEEDDNNQSTPRKRNGTWEGNKNIQTDIEDQKTKTGISSCSFSAHVSSGQILSDQKKDQLQRLKIINSQIQQKNNKLIAEIQNVRNNINTSSAFQHPQDDIQSIDEKFKKFQKTCQQQQAKYLSLKSQMEKLSPTIRRTNGSENDIDKDFNVRAVQLSHAYQKGDSHITPQKNINKKKNQKPFMATMPKLDRDLDQ